MRLERVPYLSQAIKRHAVKKRAGMRRGLMKAGLFLQRESMKLCPVETGNLRSGAFTRFNESAITGLMEVRVGYVAEYAAYVHEDLTKAHGAAFNAKYKDQIAAAQKSKSAYLKRKWHKRGPDQQAKFLETPFRTHLSTIALIIRTETD
jgi:hypothetical protein